MRSEKESAPNQAHHAGVWGRAKWWLTRLIGSKPQPLADQLDDESGSVGSPGARLTADELAIVRKDLRLVLDQHPESRAVMRHVRALEYGLHRKGRHAIEEMPIEMLRLGLGQVDLLAGSRRLPGLSLLRSKAAVSIAERERIAAARERNRQQQLDVEVGDASHTTFLEANEEWERSLTGQSSSVPLDGPTGLGSTPVPQAKSQ
jgi:hypothetical protein